MVLVDRPTANTKFVRTETKLNDAPKPGQRRRYRPGKLPDFMPDEDGDDEEDEGLTQLARRSQKQVHVMPKADRRLQRLELAETAPAEGRRRKPRREAEILDEEETARPTPAVGERPRHNKIQRDEQPELLAQQAVESDEEEEYEEVTESESEEQNQIMAKPTFVGKKYRVTHLEQRKMEIEKEELEMRQLDIKQKRREDTRRLVVEDVKKQDEMANNEAESDGEMPDDNDYSEDEELEHARWVLREQTRIKRYKEERQQEEAAKIEIERRRNLTDDQRKQEDIDYQKKLQEMGLDKKKVKWNFLQKYYHKGAYYQHTDEKGMEAEEIYRRDVGHAVGGDRFNKELLPKAMHVRGEDFGKRGQSKWTHLVDQDTSYQKDTSGGMMENPFVTTTFASSKSSTMSASQAHQSSENAMMFRHAKATSLTPQAIGSAAYRTGGIHKDLQLERPSKRAK